MEALAAIPALFATAAPEAAAAAIPAAATAGALPEVGAAVGAGLDASFAPMAGITGTATPAAAGSMINPTNMLYGTMGANALKGILQPGQSQGGGGGGGNKTTPPALSKPPQTTSQPTATQFMPKTSPADQMRQRLQQLYGNQNIPIIY